MPQPIYTFSELQAQAEKIARESRFTGHPITVEAAVSELLEQNPDVYASYKAHHDLAPTLQKLKQLGLKLVTE